MLGKATKRGKTSSTASQLPLYVHYGCGNCAPDGWENFDASPRLRIERLPVLGKIVGRVTAHHFPVNVRWGDISSGLPIPDASAAGIYCSHVLEHLPRSAMLSALSQTYRMLRPGGIFRAVVPDLEWRAQRYIRAAAQGDALAADQFLESCSLGVKDRQTGIIALLRRSYGHSAHLWMYDFTGLKTSLHKTGFVRIRRCSLGDSGDEMFARVEDSGRFFEDNAPELAVEAVKPA
jgi:hypothetical protein